MADPSPSRRVILASASQARRAMLQAAGVVFDVVPANVDEAAIKAALFTEDSASDPADIAEVLGCAKASAVSRAHPDAVVIGSDQVLSLGPKLFSKPATLDDALLGLKELRGQTHQLHSCAAIAENGAVSWTHVETVDLRMRAFSDAFLEHYLATAGGDIVHCVGAYQIEGLGSQLFDRIDGDYFTVLGMPLLPLLGELRARKVLTS
jgi:septum formation protein